MIHLFRHSNDHRCMRQVAYQQILNEIYKWATCIVSKSIEMGCRHCHLPIAAWDGKIFRGHCAVRVAAVVSRHLCTHAPFARSDKFYIWSKLTNKCPHTYILWRMKLFRVVSSVGFVRATTKMNGRPKKNLILQAKHWTGRSRCGSKRLSCIHTAFISFIWSVMKLNEFSIVLWKTITSYMLARAALIKLHPLNVKKWWSVNAPPTTESRRIAC